MSRKEIQRAIIQSIKTIVYISSVLFLTGQPPLPPIQSFILICSLLFRVYICKFTNLRQHLRKKSQLPQRSARTDEEFVHLRFLRATLLRSGGLLYIAVGYVAIYLR